LTKKKYCDYKNIVITYMITKYCGSMISRSIGQNFISYLHIELISIV